LCACRIMTAMSTTLEQEEALQRAELFDELVHRLLTAIHSPDAVVRNFILATGTGARDFGPETIDEVVKVGPDRVVLVETRAPYTDEHLPDVERGLERLSSAATQMAKTVAIAGVILAVASELPLSAEPLIDRHAKAFHDRGTDFEVWSERTILELVQLHLGVPMRSLFASDLATTLQMIVDRSSPTDMQRRRPLLPVGRYSNVLVLSADFCSYSKFVHASHNNHDMISSIMGRFYRRTRQIITEHGGIVDKYMGDGVLCYWLNATPDLKPEISDCVRELIGAAVALSAEWEERVDDHIRNKGLRVGAAMGDVLFIAEEEAGEVHALSDSINVAVRLQAAAQPNSFVITNVLNSHMFRDDSFTRLRPLTLKNIGTFTAWRRTFEDQRVKRRTRRSPSTRGRS